MKGKIALEEHFAIDDTLDDSKGFFPDDVWAELRDRLIDLHGTRLRLMDEYGIEMMILSLNAPAVQAIPDVKKANEIARQANDYLAEQVRKRPDRFQALAALPMQDPDMAARELQRCVKDLGFVGALVNGFSQIGDPNTIAYLDLQQYWPFWSVVRGPRRAVLSAPAQSAAAATPRIYKGHDWLLGPIWAFGHETAVHALRLMGSGLFDKHPKLQIVLGHMGEGLPFSMWRVDNCNAWIEPQQLSGQAEDRPLLPEQFPPHDVGQLPHPGADQRDDGDGRRPHHVLDRLAVREHRPRRAVVRRSADQRGRPPQDRPRQRAEAVQARGNLNDRIHAAGRPLASPCLSGGQPINRSLVGT